MITINTVWISIISGFIALIIGGVLNSVTRMHKYHIDLIPLAIVLYTIGGVLVFTSIAIMLPLAI